MGDGWVARLGGRVLPVESLDDLRSIMSQAAEGTGTELWLTSPDGSRMCMLRDKNRALLMFLRSGDTDAGLTTRAGTEVVGSQMVSFTLENGQRDEYPASWTVSARLALEALEYFFSTTTKAPFLEWHDDSAS